MCDRASMVFGGDDAHARGPIQTEPHPVMHHFGCWEGDVDAGWSVNFLGVRTRVAFFSMFEQLADFSRQRHVITTHPVANEDYFEWIALLESVVEARDRYTMIELGAGYGKWLANAALAVRQYSGIPCRLLGIEAEPRHFAWMKEHMRDNGIPSASTRLIRAAVAPADGRVWFHVGDAADWYGQAIADDVPVQQERRPFGAYPRAVLRRFRGQEPAGRRVERVRAISLASLLAEEDFVDFVDIDVQGAEAAVLESAADPVDLLVRRIYVGTHSRENEDRIRELFRSLRWENVDDYAFASENETPWGAISFQDGVQTWLNPKLAK
jgi:FkbM family methyltransferase